MVVTPSSTLVIRQWHPEQLASHFAGSTGGGLVSLLRIATGTAGLKKQVRVVVSLVASAQNLLGQAVLANLVRDEDVRLVTKFDSIYDCQLHSESQIWPLHAS